MMQVSQFASPLGLFKRQLVTKPETYILRNTLYTEA